MKKIPQYKTPPSATNSSCMAVREPSRWQSIRELRGEGGTQSTERPPPNSKRARYLPSLVDMNAQTEQNKHAVTNRLGNKDWSLLFA